jgi:hypothetical protein
MPKPVSKRKDVRPPQDKQEKLPAQRMGERFVTTYDPAKALEIVEGLAEGRTLNELCRGVPGMPHPTTFKRWVVNNPELAKAVLTANQMSAQSLEEEALDAVRLLALRPRDAVQVSAVRAQISQLQWSAERRDPGKFGAKTQVNIRVPIQIITPLDLGYGGGEVADIYTLKATTVEESAGKAEDVPVYEPSLFPQPDRSGPRKRVLTPRNPFYQHGDKIDGRKKQSPNSNVREQGGEASQSRDAGPRHSRFRRGSLEAGKGEADPRAGGETPEGDG